MPNSSYVYNWDLPQGYRVRSLSTCSDEFESGRFFGQCANRRRSRTCDPFEARRKRKQSIRAISAKATVRLIDASSNNISSLEPLVEATPIFLAYLAKVEKLDLSHNHLSKFPYLFCDVMPQLQYVNLSHNEFSSFPYCFIETGVKVLNLSHNKIKMDRPRHGDSNVMLEPARRVSRRRLSSGSPWGPTRTWRSCQATPSSYPPHRFPETRPWWRGP